MSPEYWNCGPIGLHRPTRSNASTSGTSRNRPCTTSALPLMRLPMTRGYLGMHSKYTCESGVPSDRSVGMGLLCSIRSTRRRYSQRLPRYIVKPWRNCMQMLRC
ncbi:unnamed protein product [Sphagnum balticum]